MRPHLAKSSGVNFALLLVLFALAASAVTGASLPLKKTFIGEEKFSRLMKHADRQGWGDLPLGERVNNFALALRDNQGVLRFLHASKNHGKVVLDDRLSTYLNKFRNHSGIYVARPLEVKGS